jgi:hypothetical protein
MTVSGAAQLPKLVWPGARPPQSYKDPVCQCMAQCCDCLFSHHADLPQTIRQPLLCSCQHA